jgi:outer membrane putative beta-barrel porin/alpha-amylase
MKLRLSAMILLAALPAQAEDSQPICADRPGKNTSPCIVQAGRWQLEVTGLDDTLQRRSGVTTDTLVAVAPTLKYGLSDTLELQLSVTPMQDLRVHGPTSDITTGGHGDTWLRAKWEVAGDGGTGFTAIAEPYVKLATATRGLGDGALEEGLLLPLGYDWGNNWQLSTTPEVDLLLDGSGHGRHAQFVDAAELNWEPSAAWTLGLELWTSQNFDPGGAVRQYSADGDVAYLVDNDTQLDAGVNFGLNRDTPDVEFYFGVSRRF